MALGLLLGISPAVMAETDEAAQEAEDRHSFDSADANADGKITLEEALALDPRQEYLFRRLFIAVDRDKNGVILFDELRAFLKKFRAAMKAREEKFAAMDLDADGKLTLAEATADKRGDELLSAEAEFHKADANSDGFVDMDELKGFVFRQFIEM